LICKFATIALLMLYLAVVFPMASYMRSRPIALKLGYMPDAKVLKVTFPDYRSLLAQGAVVRVLFYFGTMVEKLEHKVRLQPEYLNMFMTMQTAVKLDPYNMDAYYFTQAAFTWELGRIKEVNDMLVYGMKYRTWDYQLPFYAGFNAAYFQKDYKQAATYMKRAAQLSGNPLLTNLAARYLYESGETDLGLLFLESMEKGAKDKKVRQLYAVRREALSAVKKIQDALAKYRLAYGMPPAHIRALVAGGFLDEIPKDPYGGEFYIAEDGTVRTTSKFAFAGKKMPAER
jgi:tetratricopeptide (TPR) repeat protein